MNKLQLPQIKRLIICATPRSGSETLCKLLSEIGLGDPKEYLNPWVYSFTEPTPFNSPKKNTCTEHIVTHLSQLMTETYLTNNSVFSIKVQGWHIERYLQNSIGDELFDQAHVIHLIRPDIKQQILSQAMAKLTGQWYDDRDDGENFSDQEIKDAYTQAYKFILSDYNILNDFFAKSGIIPNIISSQSLFDNPFDVIKRIANDMGLDIDSNKLTLAATKTKKYQGQNELRKRLENCAKEFNNEH